MSINKNFRLFLSSTFSDLVLERNKLQAEVFPKLRNYCEERGFSFQVVDLRWGISEKDGWDHRTLDICLQQVKYCKGFLKPNFAILLSERYGWIPVPRRITQNNFEVIRQYIEPEDNDLFATWYKLDTNTGYYLLQNIDEHTSEAWWIDEYRLRLALQKIVRLPAVESQLGEEYVERFFQSATEQEIVEGLFKNDDVSINNIHTFYRRLGALENVDATKFNENEARVFAKYCDFNQSDQKIDLKQHAKCKELVAKVESQYSKHKVDGNLHKFDLNLSSNEYQNLDSAITGASDYLNDFCASFMKQIEKAIDREIDASKQQSSDSETDIQRQFLTSRTNKVVFAKRTTQMNKINEYITHASSSRYPLILVGESGSGKSSLIAHAIKETEAAEDAYIFYRFIGISEQSSTDYQLVSSLNEQVKSLLQEHQLDLQLSFNQLDSESILEQSYDGLCKLFIKRIEAISDTKKVIIFIDALDQFILNSRLEFIPPRLKNNVKFIVSTLPLPQARYIKIFKLRMREELQQDYILNISSLLREQMSDAYTQFKDLNNILQNTQAQKDFILKRFGTSPLAFKIMLEESKKWRSYDDVSELPQELNSPNPDDAIRYFFNSLPQQKILVQLTLGLLAASRDGLHENDLVDILSETLLPLDEILNSQEKLLNSHYDKPTRIPDSIWLRLNADLKPYLTERSLNGITKIGLFHRRFINVALTLEHDPRLSNDVRQLIIGYNKEVIFSVDNKKTNEQLLNAYRELYYQYSKTGDFAAAFQILLEPELIYLFALTDDMAQLMGEYHLVYQEYEKALTVNNQLVPPNNYAKFIELYSWLCNIEPIIEARDKKLLSLWAVLSQLGHDNQVALIQTSLQPLEYYCTQTPTFAMRSGTILKRLEDIENIIGVFNVGLSITMAIGANTTETTAHMIVLTAAGYVYKKPIHAAEFSLLSDELGQLTGALQDGEHLLIWNNNGVKRYTIERDDDAYNKFKLVETKCTSNLHFITQVFNTIGSYYIECASGWVRLAKNYWNNYDELNYTLTSTQLLYNKSLCLDEHQVKNIFNEQLVGNFDDITGWYQSPFAVDLILGWDAKTIYQLDINTCTRVQEMYTGHKAAIVAIYGLRNYRFISLSIDGELHYWNSAGKCLGVAYSNYFNDIVGVTEFGDKFMMLWNKRGYALKLELDQLIPPVENEITVSATPLALSSHDDRVVPELSQDFSEWCLANNYTPDKYSCHSIDKPQFSFVDTNNNQLIFVRTCQIINTTRFIAINIWMSIGKIHQVIQNDADGAVLLVNGQQVSIARYGERQADYQPLLSQIIYSSLAADTLINDAKFKHQLELLKNSSDLNKLDAFGFTPLLYTLDKSPQLVEILIKVGANVEVESYGGNTPLMLASANGHSNAVAQLLQYKPRISKWSLVVSFLYASQHGHSEVVAQLLSAGADVQAATTDGATALISASLNGHSELVVQLLSAGADVHAANNDCDTPLMVASLSGHVKVVAQLLAAGADVHTADTNGATALMYASKNGHSEVVAQLLSSGADVHDANKNDNTPLMSASEHGHSEVVAQLLAAGANFDVANNNGDRPLMAASLNGHSDVVAQLLSAGANFDAANKNDATPLMSASQNGHSKVVAQLLACGANLHALDNNYGGTALMSASYNGHNEVVEKLLATRRADVDASNNNGWTALLLASLSGHVKVVGQLLAAGADVHASNKYGGIGFLNISGAGQAEILAKVLATAYVHALDKDGVTALFVASKNGHSEVVAHLLSAGAVVDAWDYGWTALMLASANGDSEVVAQLLAAGANVNVSSNDGGTALLYASQMGHREVVAQLLSAGANVNVSTNDNGFSPLLQASKNGNREVVKQLLAVGADVNVSSNDGGTALLYASYHGHSDVVAQLLAAGADVNAADNNGWTALLQASNNGHSKVVAQLLAIEADVNVSNNDGWTALIFASGNSNVEIVSQLLDGGVDVNVINDNGVTALLIASEDGHAEVVAQLLAAGADVNASDNDGWTALLFVSMNGHAKVTAQLLAAGADVDASNNNGATALMYAKAKNHLDIVELLTRAVNSSKAVEPVHEIYSEENIMNTKEFYTQLFTAMLEKGYYDPDASYAENNTKILEQLSSDSQELNGAFYFQPRDGFTMVILIESENKSFFKIFSQWKADDLDMELKFRLVNKLLQTLNMPTTSLMDDGHIVFEFFVFMPVLLDGALESIEWFIGSTGQFIHLFKGFLEQANK